MNKILEHLTELEDRIYLERTFLGETHSDETRTIYNSLSRILAKVKQIVKEVETANDD